MTSEELDELYRSFTRYAWRLEALDVYGVPEENELLQAFLDGREPPAMGPNPWADMTAAAAAAGRPFGRVRLVGRPVTDYTRWEFTMYPSSIEAGEQVRVLDRAWLAEEDDNPLWNVDFWLFDDEIAVVQHYAANGEYLGPSRAPDPAPFVELRKRALELSVPFSEYTLLPDQRREEATPVTRPEVVSLDQ